ncbi:hypothetical protein LCGC14_1294270 [marine sediment metagenome]|uniref:C2H2-type domain-containing protein n=1 Tax=marine sediment metagenome TaxID=412755 RepID=A0A0F9KT98_9ZZZZ
MKPNNLEKRIEILKTQAEKIQKSAVKLLKSAPLKQVFEFNEYGFGLLSEDLRELQQYVITEYNTWYNALYPLIKKYLPHQLDEFKKRYRLEKDRVFTYDITRILELNVIFLEKDRKFIIEKFQECFTYQKSQLLSLKYNALNNQVEHLSSLNFLEETLVQNIYDYLLKNPSVLNTKSRSISRQKKIAIKRRDKYVCQICEEKFIEAELEVDHIFPHSFGGSNQITNLMTLCRICNADKSNRLDYYRSDEGKLKLQINIEDFVKDLLLIQNFGKWLGKVGDARRKNSALIAKKEIDPNGIDEIEYEETYEEEQPRRPNIRLIESYLEFFSDSEITSEDLDDRLRRVNFEVYSYNNLKDISEEEKDFGVKFIRVISECLLVRKERNLINKSIEILYNLCITDTFIETIKSNCLDLLTQFYNEKKYFSYLIEVLDKVGYFEDILKEIIKTIDDKNLDLLEKLGGSIISAYRSEGLAIVKALQSKQKDIKESEETHRLKNLIRKFIQRIEGLMVV